MKAGGCEISEMELRQGILKLFPWSRILLYILLSWSLLCAYPEKISAVSPQSPDAGFVAQDPANPETEKVLVYPLKEASVPGESSDLPWKAKLNRIAAGRDALSARLDEVHSKLTAVVMAEKPEFLARIEKEAAKPAATGYGLLPAIVEDEPDITDIAPTERTYSIAALGDWLMREHGLVAELASCLEYRLCPLERAVDSYNKRVENFRNLDAHVSYHSFWQDEVKKWPAFWARKKESLALYRSWRAPAKKDGNSRRSGEIYQKINNEMLRINPSPALCIERHTTGEMLLPVRITTDIMDETFLAAFAEGVERFWNGSPAMKDGHLRIALTWDRKTPESIYPKGPPRKGEHIDLAGHRKQFGSAPFMLTTGGDATHALQGTIYLGTSRTSRRVLAHEFSHLLGFEDGYIRAYDGSADDQDGVVFFEVTPFPESLLASPGKGRVTLGMVESLLDVYGKKECRHKAGSK